MQIFAECVSERIWKSVSIWCGYDKKLCYVLFIEPPSMYIQCLNCGKRSGGILTSERWGGGVPLPSRLRGLGSVVSSPSGIWGGLNLVYFSHKVWLLVSIFLRKWWQEMVTEKFKPRCWSRILYKHDLFRVDSQFHNNQSSPSRSPRIIIITIIISTIMFMVLSS